MTSDCDSSSNTATVALPILIPTNMATRRRDHDGGSGDGATFASSQQEINTGLLDGVRGLTRRSSDPRNRFNLLGILEDALAIVSEGDFEDVRSDTFDRTPHYGIMPQ